MNWTPDIRCYSIIMDGGLNGKVSWRIGSPSWEWWALQGYIELARGCAATPTDAMRRCEAVLVVEAGKST